MIVVMIGHKGIPTRSGGIERHVEELSTSLASMGVRVISFDRKWYVGESEPLPGILRRWSYGIRTKHLDAITHTLSAIFLARRDNPDVIHIHGVGPSLCTPVARIVHPRARVVSTFHCVDRSHAKWGRFAQLMLWLGERFACAFAHRTITVSDGLANYCLKAYECQTSVIPNGVRMKSGSDPKHLEQFSLRPGNYFAMVTRLIPHKNVHVAIEAHRMLANRRPDIASQYPLVVVGGSSFTNEYEQELKKLADAHPHVILVGEQHGHVLLALQEHAAAHLSVSSSEGMSIALLESMSLRQPLIVSDIPENMEVVEQDALVVRTNDADALSRALENMVDMTDTEREAMGDALYTRIKERHDWDVIAHQTERLYREVCSTKKLKYA